MVQRGIPVRVTPSQLASSGLIHVTSTPNVPDHGHVVSALKRILSVPARARVNGHSLVPLHKMMDRSGCSRCGGCLVHIAQTTVPSGSSPSGRMDFPTGFFLVLPDDRVVNRGNVSVAREIQRSDVVFFGANMQELRATLSLLEKLVGRNISVGELARMLV